MRCAASSERNEGAYLADVVVNGSRWEAVFDAHNRRVKLYDIDPAEFAAGQAALRTAAGEHEAEIFSKVTVYARAGAYAQWLQQGFRKEAIIRGFFRDGADAHLWAIYPDASRCHDAHAARHARTLSQALARDRAVERQPLPAGYVSQSAVEKDAWDLAALLRDTFDDYPTPIRGAYIKGQIAAGRNCFRIIRDGDGALVAAASAEMDFQRMTAELTDCMTRPADRGRGLMSRLLRELEHALLTEHGIRHFYSIARADEVGINCVFAKHGYEFTGRLINNCRMPNGWESMNVWCKAAGAA